MRKLYSFEHPVLPLGMINLKTGKNKFIDDFLDSMWSFVLIEKDGKYALIAGASNNYEFENNIIYLAHDQTHRDLGKWKYQGNYKNLNALRKVVKEKNIKGFVFK